MARTKPIRDQKRAGAPIAPRRNVFHQVRGGVAQSSRDARAAHATAFAGTAERAGACGRPRSARSQSLATVGNVMFMSFTTKIDYGFSASSQARLSMFAIDVAKVGSADPPVRAGLAALSGDGRGEL